MRVSAYNCPFFIFANCPFRRYSKFPKNAFYFQIAEWFLNFKIVTDIAGLSHLKLPIDEIKVGDRLTFKQTPSGKDKDEVRLFKNDKEVGFVKKIHNRIFRNKPKLNLIVKAVSQNGFIKQVFFTISTGNAESEIKQILAKHEQ